MRRSTSVFDHERRHRERVGQQELQRLDLLRLRHRREAHALLADVHLLRVEAADDACTTWPISVLHCVTMRP